MIRKFQEKDINKVSEIWLETNIAAHNFIPAQYWKDHLEYVKRMLLQAEIYVYTDEETGEIRGFIGLDDNYIEGIFIQGEVQSRGIGKQLLDAVKGTREELSLSVYRENSRAISFYQREGFRIQREGIDENTGEKEYIMVYP